MAEGREFGLVQFSRTSRPMARTMEKSRARRTINDAPLPKVNWYLSHIFFLCFFKIFLLPHLFFPTAYLKFSKSFFACWNFSSTFSFLQKYQKYFLSFKSFGKNNLDIFSSKILVEHPMVIFHMTVGVQRPKGSSSGPNKGSAEPW